MSWSNFWKRQLTTIDQGHVSLDMYNMHFSYRYNLMSAFIALLNKKFAKHEYMLTNTIMAEYMIVDQRSKLTWINS